MLKGMQQGKVQGEITSEKNAVRATVVILLIAALLLLISCAKNPETFMKTAQDNLTPADPVETGHYLIITGSLANHVVVARYDLDQETPVGEYITDFRATGDSPRGLAPFGPDEFILSVETSDALYQVNHSGVKTSFHSSGSLTGNLFDIALGPLDLFYAIETNNIEVFDRAGTRATTSVIPTTVGGCVLSTPRSMDVTSSGELLVTNTGGAGNLLFYNITTPTATCVRSVAIGNTPVGIKAHSNGLIYIGTQANDRISSVAADGTGLAIVWATNTAVISDPSAIVEMPNGDLLVASSATNTIERITTAGVRVGVNPFIRDAFSLSITDMIIVSKETGL
jgi:hypothetical protein